jgi:oligopeptide transport system ATP-binding protein
MYPPAGRAAHALPRQVVGDLGSAIRARLHAEAIESRTMMCAALPASEPLLDVRDLRTRFKTDEGIVRAVDGVSFTVGEGERVGIVGESGSGKSVTALSIMRLIDPPAGWIAGGEVSFRGRDLLAMSERELRGIRGRSIAMIFQDAMTSLDPVFTVGDQLVETIVQHAGVTKTEARERAVKALRDVQIPQAERRLDDYPHQFSGGMRQRVMIAIALSCEPSLVIADEPTTALDVTTQAQTLELLYEITDQHHTAVVLITHDLAVVAGFCETVHVMYAGRLVESGTAEDIFYRPMHPYTAGLLGSVTRLDRDPGPLPSIPGSPPSLVLVPSGCAFHPRCAFAEERCVREAPALHAALGSHTAACHFAGQLELTREGVAR